MLEDTEKLRIKTHVRKMFAEKSSHYNLTKSFQIWRVNAHAITKVLLEEKKEERLRAKRESSHQQDWNPSGNVNDPASYQNRKPLTLEERLQQSKSLVGLDNLTKDSVSKSSADSYRGGGWNPIAEKVRKRFIPECFSVYKA